MTVHPLSRVLCLTHSSSLRWLLTPSLLHSLPLTLVASLTRFIPQTLALFLSHKFTRVLPLFRHTRSLSHSLFLLLTPSLFHSLSVPLRGLSDLTRSILTHSSSFSLLVSFTRCLSHSLPPSLVIYPSLAVRLTHSFTRVLPLSRVLCPTHLSSCSLVLILLSPTRCLSLSHSFENSLSLSHDRFLSDSFSLTHYPSVCLSLAFPLPLVASLTRCLSHSSLTRVLPLSRVLCLTQQTVPPSLSFHLPFTHASSWT